MRLGLYTSAAAGLLLALPADAKRRDKTDPRDAALAELTREVSAAIVAAAQGEPVDPRWTWTSDAFGIRTTEPEVAERLATLGEDPAVVMTILEIEGAATGGTGPGYLRGSAVVLADGRVRWLTPSIRPKNPYTGPTSGLDAASPALAGAVQRLADALADPACPLPLLTSEEVADIPEVLGGALPMDPARLSLACESALAGAFQWKPSVDDVTVLVRVGDSHVALRSAFVVDDGRLLLDEVRVGAVEPGS